MEQLQQLAEANQLKPGDLVWKAGMPQWAPASTIEGLFGTTTPTAEGATLSGAPVAQAVAPAEASPLGYFSHSGGIPPRAATVLRGFAAATGDRGDWPLSDQHLVDLQRAEAARKKIRAAAGLYRGLFALTVIAAVIFLMVGVLAMAASGSARSAGMLTGGTLFALLTAISVLYWFASNSTRKCRRWAPLTMFILFILSTALQLFSLVAISMNSRNGGVEAIGPILGMILPAAFAVYSWQAFAAIPKFLASPMWCQEALVNAKL